MHEVSGGSIGPCFQATTMISTELGPIGNATLHPRAQNYRYIKQPTK